jgi:membrane protein implicated in regulation of membrane protease activity
MAVIYVGWLILGLLLLVAEMHTAAFYAMFLGIGAFAAAIVAFLTGGNEVWAQALVALAVSIAGVVLVRPWMAKHFARTGAGAISPGTYGGFVGERALATDAIGDELHPGHVRLAGESWLAISDDGSAIDGGSAVTVTSVRGTTLFVRSAGAATS